MQTSITQKEYKITNIISKRTDATKKLWVELNGHLLVPVQDHEAFSNLKLEDIGRTAVETVEDSGEPLLKISYTVK